MCGCRGMALYGLVLTSAQRPGHCNAGERGSSVHRTGGGAESTWARWSKGESLGNRRRTAPSSPVVRTGNLVTGLIELQVVTTAKK